MPTGNVRGDSFSAVTGSDTIRRIWARMNSAACSLARMSVSVSVNEPISETRSPWSQPLW